MLDNSLSSSSSRPTIAFPLGLALLVLVLVCISGLFSCCYHWNKLQSLLCYEDDQSSSDDDSVVSPNPKSIQVEHKNGNESLIVLMPGDDVPKFVALPTPRRSTLQIETLSSQFM
ncbi:uncharacterized protein At5g65660-like [Solanum dulcamara]|uniref:uncharacterized protein At5g65660-like n=1 Tax=Solanum dulcamara TaxID=45834 RepID=UPI002486A52F|nr:uncharacterized protein At5g65660-like [Solanum dulcamara]